MSKHPKFKKLSNNSIKTAGWADLLKFFNIGEDFNEDKYKNALSYLGALPQGFSNLNDKYDLSAIYHALEMDKNRGFNGTSASQGAYEMNDLDLMKEIENFKKNPPSNLKDLLTDEPVEDLSNINVPETSDRYKAMREKLYNKSSANSVAKFVKTSAKENIDELNSKIPNWDIKDVLNDMAKVTNDSSLSSAEKQRSMMSVLSEYEKSIAPLSQYLRKNDIKYK
jgi:hypothetical protein